MPPQINNGSQNIPEQLTNTDNYNTDVFSSLPFEAQSCKQHN